MPPSGEELLLRDDEPAPVHVRSLDLETALQSPLPPLGAPLVSQAYLNSSPQDLARMRVQDYMDYCLDKATRPMRGANRVTLWKGLRRTHSCFF